MYTRTQASHQSLRLFAKFVLNTSPIPQDGVHVLALLQRRAQVLHMIHASLIALNAETNQVYAIKFAKFVLHNLI